MIRLTWWALILYGLCLVSIVLCDLDGGGEHFRIYDDHRHLVGDWGIPEQADLHDHADDFIVAEQLNPHAWTGASYGLSNALLPADVLALAPLLPPPIAD